MTEQTQPYDPDAYKVDEVRDYLKAATADEVGRVKAAEAEGQNRKGIMDWAPDKPSTTKDGGDGYDRVPVDDPYPAGTPSAWGHRGQDEGEEGSDVPLEDGEIRDPDEVQI